MTSGSAASGDAKLAGALSGALSGDWRDAAPTGIARPALAGFAACILFAALFGYWAATAPLSGAIVAHGVVQAAGQNQKIEHLGGGIVRAIAVAEGQRVAAGDLLLALDDTALIAERNRVSVALAFAEATKARAEAERDDAEVLSFPPSLLERAAEPGLAGDIERQKAQFTARLAVFRSQVDAIGKRIRSVEEEIAGMEIQRAAEEAKIAILREDLASKTGLLEKGLAQRDDVNALRRAEADSAGRIGALTASAAQRRATIEELRQEQITLGATRRETAAREANETRTKIGDLREQLAARQEALARTQIAAPADGVIVRIAKNTIGGVVRPGETILELLPSSDELLVDARVLPGDVDAIHVGQPARLRLTALNQRTTPEIGATVTYVSADRLTDAATGEPYYTARLAIGRQLPEGIGAGQIIPGMPVEAFIGTGERTFVEYLLRPLADSFAKAFREE